jgi:hypothetical protein
LQEELRSHEPMLRQRLGQALTRAVKEGDPRKAVAGLQALAPLLREKE